MSVHELCAAKDRTAAWLQTVPALSAGAERVPPAEAAPASATTTEASRTLFTPTAYADNHTKTLRISPYRDSGGGHLRILAHGSATSPEARGRR
jgi:hypothetical protein